MIRLAICLFCFLTEKAARGHFYVVLQAKLGRRAIPRDTAARQLDFDKPFFANVVINIPWTIINRLG